MKKWIFLAGAGVGYVLGTRAGREKYLQMKAKAQEVLESPTVKDAKEVVLREGVRLYDGAKSSLEQRARDLRHKIEDSTPHSSPRSSQGSSPVPEPAPAPITPATVSPAPLAPAPGGSSM